MIKITFSTIDGINKTHSFRGLEAARKFANKVVGEQDIEGGYYAVSPDGIAKITWAGCTRSELFAFVETPTKPLNAVTTFYTKGDDLYCRERGYTFDHAHQPFGHVIEVVDNVTGDHRDGWALRHVEGQAQIMFDEDKHYATREAALAEAKAAKLAFIEYLDHDTE